MNRPSSRKTMLHNSRSQRTKCLSDIQLATICQKSVPIVALLDSKDLASLLRFKIVEKLAI
jgi:hypothetical protein